MTVVLPNDLERFLRDEVARGHFASIDDAIAEAARLLLRESRLGRVASSHPAPKPSGVDLGSIGALSDDSELLDEIVADAYRERGEERWRELEL